MRILFLMTAKYPTHKAYGVTTGETAKTLRLHGNYVEIWSLFHSDSNELVDQYGNKVKNLDSAYLGKIRNKLLNSRLFGSLAFVISSMLITRRTLFKLRIESRDIIWLRDIYLAYKVSKKTNAQVVLELHQWPKEFHRKILRVLTRKSNVILLTIRESTYHRLQSRFPRAVICYAPMGVSSNFIDEGSKKLANSEGELDVEPLKVCYVGRLFSSGQDNGVANLIKSWKSVSSDKAKLSIIGISKSELSALRMSLDLESIEIVGHIDHVKMPEMLSTYDVGIIPYEESRYNSDRFPIKAVEYCAVGLNIVATNTKSLQEVLGSEFAYFYNPIDPFGLANCIDFIVNDRREARKRSLLGHMWAQDYTYENRLQSVYPILGGSNP